jgi:hypothetical protein
MSDVKPANLSGTDAAAEVLPPEPAGPTPALLPAPETASRDKLLDACHATLASIGASQSAVASEAAAIALEVDAIARTMLNTTGDGVAALLRAKSMADAVEIQLALTRRNLDAVAAGSARLGELGLRLLAGTSKPFIDVPPHPPRDSI